MQVEMGKDAPYLAVFAFDKNYTHTGAAGFFGGFCPVAFAVNFYPVPESIYSLLRYWARRFYDVFFFDAAARVSQKTRKVSVVCKKDQSAG